MSTQYNADAIEVLNGLEPVRRRPGMYTDTTRPNHLGQEVIDNSVDEALAGHARNLEVILHEDQSLEVIDDGRGMPVDIHPEEGVSGVELILCKLHAGASSPTRTISSPAACTGWDLRGERPLRSGRGDGAPGRPGL
jgi:topoisomerase-4 subunit B